MLPLELLCSRRVAAPSLAEGTVPPACRVVSPLPFRCGCILLLSQCPPVHGLSPTLCFSAVLELRSARRRLQRRLAARLRRQRCHVVSAYLPRLVEALVAWASAVASAGRRRHGSGDQWRGTGIRTAVALSPPDSTGWTLSRSQVSRRARAGFLRGAGGRAVCRAVCDARG